MRRRLASENVVVLSGKTQEAEESNRIEQSRADWQSGYSELCLSLRCVALGMRVCSVGKKGGRIL